MFEIAPERETAAGNGLEVLPTPYTVHPTHSIPLLTPYTLHFTPYTLLPTPYTLEIAPARETAAGHGEHVLEQRRQLPRQLCAHHRLYAGACDQELRAYYRLGVVVGVQAKSNEGRRVGCVLGWGACLRAHVVRPPPAGLRPLRRPVAVGVPSPGCGARMGKNMRQHLPREREFFIDNLLVDFEVAGAGVCIF